MNYSELHPFLSSLGHPESTQGPLYFPQQTFPTYAYHKSYFTNRLFPLLAIFHFYSTSLLKQLVLKPKLSRAAGTFGFPTFFRQHTAS